MKLSEVKAKLAEAGRFDTVGQSKGMFIASRGFFYTNGMTSDKLAAAVQRAIPTAAIVEHRQIWKPFRGGATTASQSHFLVRFTA